MLKKQFVICLIFSAFILNLYVSAAKSSEAVPNEAFELIFNEEDVSISVADKKTGLVVHSMPPEGDSETTTGFALNQMKSILIVDFVDENQTLKQTASYVGSTLNGSIGYNETENGIKILFNFENENENFSIPVLFTVSQNSLTAEIIYKEIKENGSSRITEIALLPYFGAVKKGHEGYVFIPDGSGAIINPNHTNPMANIYSEPVFGRDISTSLTTKEYGKEKIRLPVFGIKNDDMAFLSVIEGAEANARINAVHTGYSSDYTSVYPSFTYRQRDVASIADKDWNARQISVLSSITSKINPKVSYYFLDGDKSYNGMAEFYRNYLIEKYELKKIKPSDNTPVFLHYYAGDTKKSSFLGFSVNRMQTVTTFSQIEKASALLKDSGVKNQQIILNGFEKGGYNPKTAQISFDSKFGGNKGYRRLTQNIQAYFYRAASFSILYKSGFSFAMTTSAAKRINGEAVTVPNFMLSTGARNDSAAKEAAMNKKSLEKAYNKYSKSFKPDANNQGLYLRDLGDILYSDFNKKVFTERDEMAEAFSNILTKAKSSYSGIIVDGGNLYAAVRADSILNASLNSSGYDFLSDEIPFYQMVFHGLVTLVSAPYNSVENEAGAFLKSLEFGVPINYNLTGETTERLSGTRLSFLYSSYYADNAKSISAYYKKFNKIHHQLQNQFITHSERSGDLSVTTYENGTVIAVNYGKAPVKYKEIEIEAGGFHVINT